MDHPIYYIMENNKCSKLCHTHLQATGVVDRSTAAKPKKDKKGRLNGVIFP